LAANSSDQKPTRQPQSQQAQPQKYRQQILLYPNAEALKTAVSNSNSGALDEMVVINFTLPIKAYVMDVRLERNLPATSISAC
jgi:hypothetical protein